MSLKVAIVGPGRSKQGTGPFIARTFKQLACDVQAVASSSLDSAKQAAQALKNDFQIECSAYENLPQLLKSHSIDIVAISSPAESHLENLIIAIQAGCHVFCEKPLWWTQAETIKGVQSITNQAIELVNTCNTNKVLLQLNTQWPFTLPTYYQLYPQLKKQANIRSFSMWLSPQSQGNSMIIDAAPHLLSMLYALLGAGKINNIEFNDNAYSAEGVMIEFDYLHACGDTQVSFSLQSSDKLPKPAAYAINGLRVDRHVELTNYLISLQSNEHQLPVVDPLESSIKNFIGSIHSKASSDEVALIDGMTHLAQIYQAAIQH